ncbi:splicing factor 3A subunit 3-like [Panonychus citri]|uniref:splicing factor 3A subunit 3-like n=1 Tax=Panonychus citri TaxID=50023 RepID=UPI002307AA5D|nr:splicing factor 3A subunit 3-like [Panonychus citri]
MESIIEQQRNWHEERERVEDTMVKEMMAKKTSNKDQINSEHRLKTLLDRYIEVSQSLIDSYEDKDGLRKEEMASMTGSNEFSEFYGRLRTIKEFYKKSPNESIRPMSLEFDDFLKERETGGDLVDFTAEEGYGKFLDLNDCFLKYRNLKGIEKINYLKYLSQFDNLFDIPKDRKMTTEYKQYLESLLDYLMDYCSRVKPLLDLEDQVKQISVEFEKQWESGNFPGWPKETSSALTRSGAQLDLSAFSSAAELASLGLDRLKTALMALNLKCGGTLEERANRLWSTKGKTMDELDPNLFAKGKPGKVRKNVEMEKRKGIAFLEAQIYNFSEILSEQRHATKENVQRKQARTVGEREASDEDDSDTESEDEPDSEVIYNPKNVPLGWDGKPIPYWLYKLHGLNITFTCEICGNATYKGPKAFQLHFAEWRHAHGMRCLGIPNTAHFANVTQIEDALKLWHKLKDEKQKEKFQTSTEEEYEDSEGRVVTKKTYEDLKRQGLL